MKVNVEYTSDMIRKLILDDLDSKFKNIDKINTRLDIQVRSKQNYRDKEWEIGELKVELEIVI